MHESTICSYPRPSALPSLVQYYCTIIRQYTTPLPTSRLYAEHHTILVITILCKGQLWGCFRHNVCMYVNIWRHQHMRVHARTGPRRHARAQACRRCHIPRLVRGQALHTDQSINHRSSQSHTRAKEKPHPSTITGGSNPCITKWCRLLGGL